MTPPLSRGMQVLRWLFVLLLATTGAAKLLNMPGFIVVVDSYRTLPAVLLAPAAWALMLAELALACWLISGRRLRAATLLLVLLHCMYLAWLLMALMRGLVLDNCGCFGAYLARPLSWQSPLEDLGLLVLALVLFFGVRKTDRRTTGT
jgi:hypothetical protein